MVIVAALVVAPSQQSTASPLIRRTLLLLLCWNVCNAMDPFDAAAPFELQPSLPWLLYSQFWEAVETTRVHFDIPTYQEWSVAVIAAAKDLACAGMSSSRVLLMMLRPLLILLVSVGQLLWLGLQTVVGPMLETLFYKLVSLGRSYVAWQASLTAKEWMMEAAVLASVALLVWLYKFLMRQTFTRRLRLWYQRKQLAAHGAYVKARDRSIQVSQNNARDSEGSRERVILFGCDT
jgi:hypothetical protein